MLQPGPLRKHGPAALRRRIGLDLGEEGRIPCKDLAMGRYGAA